MSTTWFIQWCCRVACQRACQSIALSLLLLVWLPAQAIDYTFPGDIPTSCRDNKDNSFSCTTLGLAAGDTIVIATPTTATITIDSGFTTGAGAKINAAGTVGLNLAVLGAAGFTSGADNIVNANIVSAGDIAIGAGTVDANNVSSTRFGGSLTTNVGFVGVGAGARVTGNIKTVTGYVSVGALSVVDGNINTITGYVSLGAFAVIPDAKDSAIVGGNINTVVGYVSAGAYSKIGGSVTTAEDGYITIGANGYVTGSLSVKGKGYVSTGDSAIVCGNISTVSLYVTIGANGKVGGSIAVSNGGANGYVSLGAGAIVNGDISTDSPYVSVGANAKVYGLISLYISGYISTGAGADVYATCCYRTDNTCLTDGSGRTPAPLMCVARTTPVVPSFCAAPPVTGPVSAVPGAFECLETSTKRPWNATERNALYTKLVGANFSFDIAALKTDGSLESNYVVAGDKTKYAKVELFVDAATPASCSQFSGSSPVVSQTVAFSSSTFSGTAGRTLTGNFNLANAYKILRCRVTECTDSTCNSATAVAPSCSSDQFSVRPSAVTLRTNANATAPSARSAPVYKAGGNFTLQGTTNPVGGYAGSLMLDSTKITAQIGSQDSTPQDGGVQGTISLAALVANTAVVNATYDEVGYFYLAAGAYRDDAFTAIDSAAGDCNADTSNDILVGGKYGCSIGNTTTVSFGRFIPDHFSVTGATVVNRSQLANPPAVTSPFTYMSEPMKVQFTLHALNVAGGITKNYAGVFSQLDTVDWLATGSNSLGIRMTAQGFKPTLTSTDRCNVAFDPLSPYATTFACAGGTVMAPVARIAGARVSVIGTPATPVWSAGSSPLAATLMLMRADVPDGPYALSIGIAPQDRDGVVGAADLDTNNDMVKDRVTVGSTSVRYGRLFIQNNYGSDLSNMNVPILAQYWNGAGYVSNLDDSLTPITAANISVTQGRGATIITSIMNGAVLTGGSSNKTFVLTKPSNAPSKIGSVILRTNATAPTGTPLNAYLPGVGVETFGLYKGGPGIYTREMY